MFAKCRKFNLVKFINGVAQLQHPSLKMYVVDMTDIN